MSEINSTPYYCSICGTYYGPDAPRPHVCATKEQQEILDQLDPCMIHKQIYCSHCFCKCNKCHRSHRRTYNCGGAMEKPPELPTNVEFVSGAKSSEKAPGYHRIMEVFLKRLAKRLELGATKYGENNWQKAVKDLLYQKERWNHAMQHMMNYNVDGDTKDDNLAAVACYLMFQMWWDEENAKNKN